MTHYTYLLINLGAVLVPFLFSFHPKLRFWDNIRSFFWANVIVSTIFILWDAVFTDLGVWGFNARYVTGVYLMGLPLEEILFFICIPYACLFSFHCFQVLMNRFISDKMVRAITIGLCLFSIIMALLFIDRLYPAVTFLCLTVFLIYAGFILKAEWLGQFYFTYLVMLVPFFIVNGILTGTGLEEPVVWYNSVEIINFRLLTIPFEDVFYGMLLIGMNVLLYKYFLSARPGVKPGRVMLSER